MNTIFNTYYEEETNNGNAGYNLENDDDLRVTYYKIQ